MEEAATRARATAAGLIEQGVAFFGGAGEERALRSLVEGAEASASAQDGDIVAEAELRWAR